ncbi:MAG: FAD-dependent oxidoreductase [Eubacteriales bacterium]
MRITETLNTPVAGSYDVIVAGAGPAGVAAAISAARAGAKTLLLESGSCLGGVWTAGQLVWLFEMDKPGFVALINRELIRRGARRGDKAERYAYEVEAMKLLLEELCLEAGVEFLLHTRVCAAYTDGGRVLRTLLTESKSGRQAWQAKAFVDATGDGDLAARAGCGFDYGQEGTGLVQPMTFMALVTVRDIEAVRPFVSFYETNTPADERSLFTESQAAWESRHKWRAFKAELRRAGVEPSYGASTLFQVREGLLALMINHEYGVNATDARQVTEATVRARAEVNRAVAALRALGGVWEGLTLASTAEYIGVREARRIHGRYTVTRQDLLTGARHDDAVVRVNFNVDVHALTGQSAPEEGLSNMGLVVQPYDIPLRALLARDVDGLLMAGRCISGDFIAHASYRVTGVAATLGQAAGVTAALSAQSGRLPHETAWADAKAMLERIYPR